MSSVFGVSAADIERRLPVFIPQGRSLALYIGTTFVFLFILLNSNIFFPDFPFWLVLGVCVMTAITMWFANFQQNLHRLQAQAELTGRTEERVIVPPFVRREQLPDIRIQLAELNREFNESDYDALRALDEDIITYAPAMSEEDINALPTHRYEAHGHLQAEGKDNTTIIRSRVEENELACSVCMEQVNEGELIRRLPCSHHFHANCIYPWLRQQGTCPICKQIAGGIH